MKMFFILLPVAVLAITVLPCEGRARRQIWPAPNDPNFYWDEPRNDRDFYNGVDSWAEPPRFDHPIIFDQPVNPQFDRPNQLFDRPLKYQDSFGEDFSFGANGNGRNQNRRTTTEDLGPITSTPKTIHVAPQGCECPMTQQFNPVCGTDGNTYRNKGLLNCYARCGTNVSQKRLGIC